MASAGSQVISRVRQTVAAQPLLALGLSNLATAFLFFYLKARESGGLKKVLVRWVFKLFMRTAKLVAKGTVDNETEKLAKKTKEMILEKVTGVRYQELPEKGMPKDQLVAKLKEESAQETKWRKGQVSGTVYHGGEEATEIVVEAFRAFAVSNPLHPDVFPFVRKMEAEVVQMCCNMFHGGEGACGTMTSGGTESILMAVKTYRDWAKIEKGVTEPELIRCKSAHAAFDKACHYLGVKLVEVDFDPETFQVDVAQVRKMVNKNTICIVGSALTYPQGVMDDVAALGKIALKANVGLHVDNCLGSLLLAFMPDAGYPVEAFDFAVPGVTSISADTHKYGFAPKGSSVALYSTVALRQHQYFVAPDWSGGIYATPAVAGSRPGALIAGTWAAMMYMGREGYIDSAKAIMKASRAIKAGVQTIPDLKLQGESAMSVVCFAPKNPSKLNIFNVGDAMTNRGWSLAMLQFPASIHICVTMVHTRDGIDVKFINDLRDAVQDVQTAPKGKFKDGMGAIYGMAESIPDRSMVDNLAKDYIDALYTA